LRPDRAWKDVGMGLTGKTDTSRMTMMAATDPENRQSWLSGLDPRTRFDNLANFFLGKPIADIGRGIVRAGTPATYDSFGGAAEPYLASASALMQAAKKAGVSLGAVQADPEKYGVSAKMFESPALPLAGEGPAVYDPAQETRQFGAAR
jgi:hypothetical protein